jgi:hypothetical protein
MRPIIARLVAGAAALVPVTAAHTAEPLSVSGIYPHLTVFNSDPNRGKPEMECGLGAVVSWAGKLWSTTYTSHALGRGNDKLFAILPDMSLEIRRESVGGTSACRMIHRESRQLFIASYAIDEAGTVRVITRPPTEPIHPLPGSTGEADAGIQAFCFRFHLTKDKSNSVPVEKPAGFHRDDYKYVLSQIAEGKITRFNQVIQLYEMPNGKFEVNSEHPHHDTGVPAESLDLAEENWGWPEAGPAERERIFARYWTHNEGLIWLLQNDPAVPQAIRDEASQWGFPKDEFTDNRHRPHHIYVRQGRRIWGEYTVPQNDAKPLFETGLPPRHADGIAVAEFEFDSHAVRKYDPAYPMLRPGYFFIAHDPFQLPYSVWPYRVRMDTGEITAH